MVIALLVAVAFFAGLVDAIAGGGGLLTLPALLAAGIDPRLALGTNKGQSVFGSGAAVTNYTRQGAVDTKRARLTFPLGLLGSVLGASAVMAFDPAVLKPVVIGLLVLAAGALVMPRREHTDRPHPSPARTALIAGAMALGLGFYDGFFGPGVGTFLVVGFVTFLHEPLLRSTGNAKVVNFASNLAAVSLFAFRHNVLWAVSLPMACAQLAGGWTGSHLAVKGGDRLIKPAVLLISAALIAKLVHDLLSR